VGARVIADRRQVLIRGLECGEVAAAELKPAEDRVDVRVLEARHEQPPGQVDPLGPRSGQVGGLGPDREDPAARHRHGLARRRRRAARDAVGGREHRPVVEQQVCLGCAGHHGLPRSLAAVPPVMAAKRG
jgi:hypothetical protein